MKSIIKIDLRKFNHIKLKEVCDKYNIDYESLAHNKKDGYAILWIDLKNKMIIAYTMKKNDKIFYTESINNFLSSMKEVEMIKQPKELTVDSVLEKISKYGIDSLTNSEKDFLDNFSK
jgi:hypothetical protein